MNSKKLWSVVIILSMLGAALPVLTKALANWETPENLSDWQSTIYETRLEIAPDGTMGAFWVAENSAGGKYGLFARFREPEQPWDPPEPISGWFDPLSIAAPTYWGAGIAPDGTAWVMWSAIDGTIPPDNQFVYAAHKPLGGAWQTDTLHGPITNISDAKMAMSPDGDLVVAWIERAGTDSFMLNERHRFAGAPIWEPHVRVDDAAPGTDIYQMYPLIGNGGMVVIMWVENNQINTLNWGVFWRTYDSGSGLWSAYWTPPVSGWSTHVDFSQPVMGPDGTVVAAWTQVLPSGKYANLSTTRPMSTGVWTTPPTQISQEKTGVTLYPPHLAIGDNGTVAAAWIYQPTGSQHYLFANARDAGGTWGSEEQLSSAQSLLYLMDIGVWPNGDALVAWAGLDNTLPAARDTGLFWSLRTPAATWGNQQQMGDYFDDIYGIALGLANDSSGHLLWSILDTTRPAGQEHNIYAARYDPTGTWDTPILIGEWAKFSYVNHDGVAIGLGGLPVGADWVVARNSSPADAVFFNEIPMPTPPPSGGNTIYLPLVLKN
jgi:hypothetical protein